MKETGILFSAPMVLEILENRKTQTRRIIKPSKNGTVPWISNEPKWDTDPNVVHDWRPPGPWPMENTEDGMSPLPCPYGLPGDRLYVKETHAWADTLIDGIVREDPVNVAYRADGKILCHEKDNVHDVSDPSWNLDKLRWRSPRFMHRWASRITLEIESVRVERLQDISEEESKLEGAPWILVPLTEEGPIPEGVKAHGHKMGFSRLWDSINSKTYPWSSNPYVWCLSFRRII